MAMEGPSSFTQAFTPHHFATYVAMDTMVVVTPKFEMERTPRMSPREEAQPFFGPFAVHYPVEVPLYLALHMRRTGICTISVPPYLHPAYLEEVLEKESTNDQTFQELPFYFFEMAKELLGGVGGGSATSGPALQLGGGEPEGGAAPLADASPDDVAKISRLVREIHLARQKKLRQGMSIFENPSATMSIPGIHLNNIVSNELEFLRHSYAVILQQAARMDQHQNERVEVQRLPASGTLSAPSERPSGVVDDPASQGLSSLFRTPSRPTGGSDRLAATRPGDTTSDSFLNGNTSLLLQAGAPGATQETASDTAGTSALPSTGLLLHTPFSSQAEGSGGETSSTMGAQTTTSATLHSAPQVLARPPPAKKRRILRQT